MAQLTFTASELWISGVTSGANAERIVIDDLALGVGPAVAGIDAAIVHARFVGGAFAARLAAHHQGRQHAVLLGVAPRLDWTTTNGVVILDVTQRVTGARVRGDARIDAQRVDALSVVWTIVVGVTLGWRWW